MITLGIDPDSKDLSLALWGAEGPIDASVLHVVGPCTNYQMLDVIAKWYGFEVSFEIPDVIALEGQQVDRRRTGKGNLFKLAHMTGAIALKCRGMYPNAELLVPTPKEWKGQLPKHAQQARLYKELGWSYQIKGSVAKRTAYSIPLQAPARFDHITNTQWKHVGDALLLAKWAYERQS